MVRTRFYKLTNKLVKTFNFLTQNQLGFSPHYPQRTCGEKREEI